MNKKNKFIVIGLIGIFCFTLFFVFSFILFPNSQTSINENNVDGRVKQLQVSNITVVIDYSGVKDNEIFRNISLINYETSVYHAILNCCEISVQNYGWGKFVKEINGVGVGWTYTVNNEPPPSMPSDYFYLRDNDTVRWTYV